MNKEEYSLPPGVCKHIKSLVSAMANLGCVLNDGFADWFFCMEHGQSIRIDGDSERVSAELLEIKMIGEHWKFNSKSNKWERKDQNDRKSHESSGIPWD